MRRKLDVLQDLNNSIFTDYKASELRNWFLFYSLIIIHDLLEYKNTDISCSVSLAHIENSLKADKPVDRRIVKAILRGTMCFKRPYSVPDIEFTDLEVNGVPGSPCAYSSFTSEDAGEFLKRLVFYQIASRRKYLLAFYLKTTIVS